MLTQDDKIEYCMFRDFLLHDGSPLHSVASMYQSRSYNALPALNSSRFRYTEIDGGF